MSAVDPVSSAVYMVSGYNSILSGTNANAVFPELWMLAARPGSGGTNWTWTNLTPSLAPAAGVAAPAQLATGDLYGQRLFQVFGRSDGDFAWDTVGATYSDPGFLTVFDLRAPLVGVPVSRMPIKVGPPAANVAGGSTVVAATFSPRFLAGSTRVGSLLYVVGGISGAFSSALVGAGSGYGPFNDSFVVIDLATGVGKQLSTLGGATDVRVAPHGNIFPVVFSSRDGARVHVWGGADYAASDVLDPATLYTYTVASDTWSTSHINARMGLG